MDGCAKCIYAFCISMSIQYSGTDNIYLALFCQAHRFCHSPKTKNGAERRFVKERGGDTIAFVLKAHDVYRPLPAYVLIQLKDKTREERWRLHPRHRVKAQVTTRPRQRSISLFTKIPQGETALLSCNEHKPHFVPPCGNANTDRAGHTVGRHPPKRARAQVSIRLPTATCHIMLQTQKKASKPALRPWWRGFLAG
jgi:hypothetical protein